MYNSESCVKIIFLIPDCIFGWQALYLYIKMLFFLTILLAIDEIILYMFQVADQHAE